MTDHKAKKHLRRMLRSFSAGRLLHLLAEIYVEAAKDAQKNGNEWQSQKLTLVEAGLIVAGYGVDVACPE